MKHTETYDVIVSGGGVAGCLTAFAILQHTELSVLLLEANPQLDNNNKHAGFDARVIALAADSLSKLDTLGVNLKAIPSCAIKHIQVSDRHHIGQVRLSSHDYHLPELGRVVSIDALGSYLLERLTAFCKSRFQYYCPAHIESVEQKQIHITLSLSNQKSANARLLIICDGAGSSTVSKLKLTKDAFDYEQSAIITNIKTQLPHHNVAFERFTSQGPIAFLPMKDVAASGDSDNDTENTMSVVWCMDNSKVESILALEQKEFLERLNQLFAYKLGKLLSSSHRVCYPLIQQSITNFTSHRVICLANSAQSLHPIAGQGFNLGIRDVYDLIKLLVNENDPGVFEIVSKYKALRTSDKKHTLNFTDSLVTLFSNQYEPLVCGRNLALTGMNLLSPLKHKFAKFSMGKRMPNTQKRH